MTAENSMDTGSRSQAEIQRTIDDLDMALAAGKIDLETHRRLQQKWEQKLQEAMAPFQPQEQAADSQLMLHPRPQGLAPAASPDMAALAGTVLGAVQGLVDQQARQQQQPASTISTQRIACPDCGAPVAQMPAPGMPARCAYCDATFTIERAESEDNRLQEELRRWLDTMVAVGAAGGTVDAASRHYIFNERLFPSLNLEVSRHLEAFETLRSTPLCIFVGGQLFGGRGGQAASTVDTSALRRLVARLDAPEVRSFAITPDDRARLDDLAIRTTFVLRLGTTLRQIAQGSGGGYRSAQKNVEAVVEMLRTAAGGEASPYARYLLASAERLAASASVLAVLGRLHEGTTMTPAEALTVLQSARDQMQAAQVSLDASAYSPIEVISARRGLTADLEQIQLLERLLTTYDAVGLANIEPLPAFTGRLERFAGAVGLTTRTTADVIELLSMLAAWFGRSQRSIAAIGDWSWLPAAIEGVRKRGGLFSKEETATGQREYWHPFHCFPVRYSEVKGSIFKGGVENEGYVLVSAIGPATPIFTAHQTPMFTVIEGAIPSLPGDNRDRPLPLRPVADSAMDAQQRCLAEPAIRNARLGEASLLLVPACFVDLSGQSGQRQLNLTLFGARSGDAMPVIEAMSQLLRRR